MNEPSVFSRIISGEWSGHFVWRSPRVVAIMTIAPIRPGHVLVIPTEQVDRYVDVSPEVWAEVSAVSQTIGAALEAVHSGTRTALVVAGFEVPHCHVHLIPATSEADLSFELADASVPAEVLAAEAERIRTELLARGHREADIS
jgi:diadenosine tetraphosphate (Ap4A) HIT family hydrolase